MFQKKQLCIAITLASTGVISSSVNAQIEEIIITATKREQSMQDVPVAVSALNEESLEQLGIANFEDYLLQLPGVTAGGSGPGQNTIYIRGIASTTPNLTTAGVSGLAPNVALYLDEQPLAQPGRNLDVYTADLERVETLSGPQGTLFGASSQAGTIRLITNKPDPNDSYGSLKIGGGLMSEGDSSNNVEGMLNMPVTDSFTLRGVVYRDKQGGYIDNVAGTRDVSESARFREAGTVRDNGVPVSLRRSGFQSTSSVEAARAAGDSLVGERVADFSDVTFLEADNADLVEDDFNGTTYTGGRISGLFDLSPDWSLLVAHSRQVIDSDGVFFADPDLGDLEIQRFEDDRIEDRFHNTNWTVTGRLAELEVVYTGAFTDRDTEQRVDYTDYLFVGQYLPYYICDTTVTYPEYNNYYEGFTDGVPGGICQAPNLFVASESNTRVATHEVRFTTDISAPIRATAGAFHSDLELEERNDFTYPGSTESITFGSQGFFPGFPFPGGYNSDPGPFPADVMFRNDIRRTDEQFGVFGEVTFDLNDELELTLGARYYDISVDFEGGANAQFCNSFQEDANRFGTNLDDLYDGDGEFTFINDCTAGGNITFTQGQSFEEIQDIIAQADPYSFARGRFVNVPNAISDAEIEGIVNALNAPDSADTSGTIFKGSLAWFPTADQMYYVTWSEGFRPGLLNRPGGAVGPNGFTVPFELQTDEVTNIEIGWKSSYLDNSLQFNGNLFAVDIEKLQTTIFDPSIANLFFSDNAADAEVRGVEGDFIWAPYAVPGLTVTGAFALLDTEITRVLTPTNDVRKGDELAFAPELQSNVRVRYEWDLMNSRLTAHVMPGISYSAESYSDIVTINRARLDSWTMATFTAGVSSDTWGVELFVNNLTDERAEITNNFVFDRNRVTYATPRTIGLRVSYDFAP